MGTDLLIVGAGLYGLTIAERVANDFGLKVTVIESRDHIGGNAWAYTDKKTGIEIHKYGAHIFHTSDKTVWEYVNRFSGFTDYRHHVFINTGGRVYPMPINLGTINQFFGASYTPGQARQFVEAQAWQASHGGGVESFKTRGMATIGEPLYKAFFEGYTSKQWGMLPEEIPGDVFSRLPVRYTYNSRYFSDTFEGLPVNGYAKWFENLADHEHIEIRLNTDFFDTSQPLNRDNCVGNIPVVYTGAVDRFFDYRLGLLGWRTIDLELETVAVDDFQGAPVINYGNPEIPFTRVIEFKHFRPERDYVPGVTVIAREFPRQATRGDEPFYPVNAPKDRAINRGYSRLAGGLENVFFGGRLGGYQYLDMDDTIGAALRDYSKKIKPFFTGYTF